MWTTERLETDWIGEPIRALGDRADLALNAFNCVEKHLGTAWLETRRSEAAGPGPALNVIFLGECLQAVEALHGFDVILAKVRADDPSVVSEIAAVRLFTLAGDVEIELAPELPVGHSIKRPDFRVRRPGERWTYIEVTRPDTSEAAKSAQELLQRLQGVTQIRRTFSMEIFLRREPTPSEEDRLLEVATDLADSDIFDVLDLPQLAIITKQPFTSAVISPINHPGEDNKAPRFGAARGVFGGDGTEPQRMVAVRVPFFDSRAAVFLKRKAKQLSKDEQGLIMMDMASVHTGMQGWNSLLRRQFQPNVHTRVGAVCLFSKSIELGKTGVQLLCDVSTIENPHAGRSLPTWIIEELGRLATVEDAKRVVSRLATGKA